MTFLLNLDHPFASLFSEFENIGTDFRKKSRSGSDAAAAKDQQYQDKEFPLIIVLKLLSSLPHPLHNQHHHRQMNVLYFSSRKLADVSMLGDKQDTTSYDAASTWRNTLVEARSALFWMYQGHATDPPCVRRLLEDNLNCMTC